MTNDSLFLQLDLVRERTLQQLELVTEEIADQIPLGYRNNLRWNLGHILTVQENLVFKLIGEPVSLPETYSSLFNNGTSPADWQIEPPAIETIKLQLTQQTERIKDKLSQRLDEKLQQPFKGIDTVGGMISFTLYHEGIHTGYMMSMRKTIQAT
ncbi:DinB family protein [Paenibacillus sp. LMG 31456]|uniref:DinB family protein n=1 Tax=Paenibacillus foliorum TaxID=2654974 RepID=A0A972GN91_9BACL|nr:DinB family protein [Paenibacillus foliorum]NOU93911.1 DinB family protein [Paenibacillus foliorum]